MEELLVVVVIVVMEKEVKKVMVEMVMAKDFLGTFGRVTIIESPLPPGFNRSYPMSWYISMNDMCTLLRYSSSLSFNML